jgi:hypothetical protein
MLGVKPVRIGSSIATRRGGRALLRRVIRALVLVGSLAFAANLIAAGALQLEHALGAATSSDARAGLPNYRDVDWAETHFREFLELEQAHHSYVGWRRLPYRGETINIDENGTRRTYSDPAIATTRTIAFFGGSTLWGSGSDDTRTIPSAFARMHPEYRALNFGETAHTAHQNLNALVQVLAEGLEPDVVVFYNGSSELKKCRASLTAFSTIDEPDIRRLLDHERRGLQTGEALWSAFEPVRMFARKMRRSVEARIFGPGERLDCGDNPAKAELIARTLFWDWLAAKHLVEGYGGRFVAAVQPVAYFSATRKDHIRIDPDLEHQYRIVYSKYDELLGDFPSLGPNFLDLRRAFDRDEYIYIDADHAGPNGNAIIAAAIGAFLHL